MPDGASNFADADGFALREPLVQLLQYNLGGLPGFVRSAEADGIAVDDGFNAELVLDHREIGVVISEEIAHKLHVVEEHDERFLATIGKGRASAFLGRCLATTIQWRSPSAGFAGHTAA
jgi:hypothetical protein